MIVPAPRRATCADLEAVPPHLVAEIIDGVLVTQSSFGDWPSASARTELSMSLAPISESKGGDWLVLFGPELSIGSDVLVADVAGWRRSSLPVHFGRDRRIAVRPDWVCEILSPETSANDRAAKRRIYAEAGVPHLWLLDLRAQLLESFALADGRWLLLQTVVAGEVRCPPFDVISFPLNDLFPSDAPFSTEA